MYCHGLSISLGIVSFWAADVVRFVMELMDHQSDFHVWNMCCLMFLYFFLFCSTLINYSTDCVPGAVG